MTHQICNYVSYRGGVVVVMEMVSVMRATRLMRKGKGRDIFSLTLFKPKRLYFTCAEIVVANLGFCEKDTDRWSQFLFYLIFMEPAVDRRTGNGSRRKSLAIPSRDTYRLGCYFDCDPSMRWQTKNGWNRDRSGSRWLKSASMVLQSICYEQVFFFAFSFVCLLFVSLLKVALINWFL